MSASELTSVLQAACQQSITSQRENGMSYDLELAGPFLKEKGLAEYIVFHQSRGKSFPWHPERSIYATDNLIIRRLTITIDHSFVGGSQADWPLMGWGLKVHFEQCYFVKNPGNMASVRVPWSGALRFHKNRFVFPDSGIAGVWLLGFAGRSDVTFQKNDFCNSDIQMVSGQDEDDSSIQKLWWEGCSAYLLKDETYYKAMIRRAHQLPESARLAIPDSPFSVRHAGLGRVAFVGNNRIGGLLMRCDALHYVFRGRNHIRSLAFRESEADLDDKIIDIGPRERIDPDYRAPLQHRGLLLALKNAATKNGDSKLTSSLELHLERIEYFLTKEHRVSLRDSTAGWIEYWQDRWRYGWRRWSSDFHGSWLRPLLLAVCGYGGLNALAWFWFEAFTITDWIAFSLRRVDQIPFYTAGLEELHQVAYDGLTPGDKNWLRLIGTVQNVWIAMCGFAFSKAIRR
ncbi:MAG: hypothetical protein F4139_01740 [Gemmatimonadetes bacterium]|nr:hypothetical protein [Gemmatimonadota bacterium]MYH51651.1 hypothetical protein [Gemmatimonadota bacterium]MYK67842.1 hypothetical protein [Gemmatimonadota bacterium]